MAGSSCEDITRYSEITSYIYTVSIRLTLLSAKIMYYTKGKIVLRSLLRICFPQKIRNLRYMYSNNYYKGVRCILIGRIQHNNHKRNELEV